MASEHRTGRVQGNGPRALAIIAFGLGVSVIVLGSHLMSKQFQHTAQRAFLERWSDGHGLYLYDKSTGNFSFEQSAKRIMGFENMQSEAMENAFRNVETCIGNTGHAGEMKDDKLVRSFAEWMALHLIRNALNAGDLNGKDYAAEVKALGLHLGAHFGFWMDFTGDVFITGDNPVVEIRDSKESFFLAALGPRRCVFLVREDKIPPFMPPTINWYIYKAASRYCVSFDQHLHIEDQPPTIMP